MTIFDMVRSLPCCECGKKPAQAIHVIELENGGKDEFFNLIPICTKHVHLCQNVGIVEFVDKNRNVKNYLKSKGWQIGKSLSHKDLNHNS